MLVAGCDQASTLTEPNSDPETLATIAELTVEDIKAYVAQKQEKGQPLTLDEQFVILSEDIPGFGGFYIEDAGRLTVRMQSDQNFTAGKRLSSAEVQTVLAPLFSEAPALASAAEAGTLVEESDYSFPDLYLWKLKAQSLDVPGLTAIDADEVYNRVRLSVTDRAAASQVREALQTLNVPPEAVIIEEGQSVMPAVDLRDHFYLAEGGFLINYNFNGSNYSCTLGFSAYRSGRLGFITNSHCTGFYGVVNGTRIYQNSASNSSHLIGSETVDPPFFPYGNGSSARLNNPSAITARPTPDGTLHRMSDAAFIQSSTTNVNTAVIARTQSRGQWSGSRTRANAFRVNGNARYWQTVVGMQLNKIGQRTGWTFGNVTSTCVVTRVPDLAGQNNQNKRFDCQSYVSAGSNSGDSGSPVFEWSGSGNNVKLHGVLWGCTTRPGVNPPQCDIPPNLRFVFSPMDGIQDDLGTLTTY